MVIVHNGRIGIRLVKLTTITNHFKTSILPSFSDAIDHCPGFVISYFIYDQSTLQLLTSVTRNIAEKVRIREIAK